MPRSVAPNSKSMLVPGARDLSFGRSVSDSAGYSRFDRKLPSEQPPGFTLRPRNRPVSPFSSLLQPIVR